MYLGNREIKDKHYDSLTEKELNSVLRNIFGICLKDWGGLLVIFF